LRRNLHRKNYLSKYKTSDETHLIISICRLLVEPQLANTCCSCFEWIPYKFGDAIPSYSIALSEHENNRIIYAGSAEDRLIEIHMDTKKLKPARNLSDSDLEYSEPNSSFCILTARNLQWKRFKRYQESVSNPLTVQNTVPIIIEIFCVLKNEASVVFEIACDGDASRLIRDSLQVLCFNDEGNSALDDGIYKTKQFDYNASFSWERAIESPIYAILYQDD